MPHILSGATDMTKVLQTMTIQVRLDFRKDFFQNHLKRRRMEEQIAQDIEEVLKKYFDDIDETELLSNHEYNIQSNNGNA